MKIKTILTDNGSQFTNRFTSTTRPAEQVEVEMDLWLLMPDAHRIAAPRRFRSVRHSVARDPIFQKDIIHALSVTTTLAS